MAIPLIRGYLYSKFLFGEVYNWIYGQKLSFTMTCQGNVKSDFQTCIQLYTSTNENFEYIYPHSYALVAFYFQKDSENVVCGAYSQLLLAA